MWGRCGVDVFVDGKIYRINEEVEEEEGNQDWGGKIIKLWMKEFKKERRWEKFKIVEKEGIQE